MSKLKPHGYRRSKPLLNTQTAVETIWAAPSDDRPTHGVQAWAVLRVEFSPTLRQMVPSAHRLYTRKHGPTDQREIMGTSVSFPRLARGAGGADDKNAEMEMQNRMLAELPGLIVTDPVVGRIFPAADVLQ